MSKFSIFALFLSATIIVIVAELLVNEYIKYPEGHNLLAANVLQTGVAGNTQADATPGTQAQTDGSFFTFSVLSGAGFKNVSLQRMPFNGIMFESVDLRDFKSVPVTVNNLLENNREKIAVFYEFRAADVPLSKEVYAFLKDKSSKLIGATINETNSFGEGSFYINYIEQRDSVFLVVNGGDNVYALTYRKDLHPLISKVLAQIPKNGTKK